MFLSSDHAAGLMMIMIIDAAKWRSSSLPRAGALDKGVKAPVVLLRRAMMCHIL
jgi:hypothetical protein